MATEGYMRGPLTEEATEKRSSDETLVLPSKKDGVKEQLEYTASDDPFGDESNSEVKYKVLEWW